MIAVEKIFSANPHSRRWLALPIVNAEQLAKELGVSAREGQTLIAELGLSELTGRRR